jgi:hypothetical protein
MVCDAHVLALRTRCQGWPGGSGDPGLAISIERAADEAYLGFLGYSNKQVEVRKRVLVGQVDTCRCE